MKRRKICLSVLMAIFLTACEAPNETASIPTKSTETESSKTVTSDKVEITLIDKLDGVTSSYCIDIAGGNKNIDIAKGLQAHTCYSYRGSLGTDQTFSTSRFPDNVLYMTDFDVCATLESFDAGAAIGLGECDGSDLQALTFSESGTITPIASPNMCFTAATESRFGRSEVHQIKALSLEACSEDKAAYQQWRVRATED